MDQNVFAYLSGRGYKFKRTSRGVAQDADSFSQAAGNYSANPSGYANYHGSSSGFENILKRNLEVVGTTLKTYSRWFDRSILRLSSEEYRREFWREASLHGYTIGPMPRTYRSVVYSLSLGSLDVASTVFWIELIRCAGFPLWFFGAVVTPKIVHKYFIKDRDAFNHEKERLRRLALRAERMAVKIRRTVNPKPTLQSIREAYQVVRNKKNHHEITPRDAALRLGLLLEDLERYVDNHVLATPGEFGAKGRAGGIKRLFEREAPDLFKHYTAIMRYKAIAKKFRQGCGAADPIPIDAVLPQVRAASSDYVDSKTAEDAENRVKNVILNSEFARRDKSYQSEKSDSGKNLKSEDQPVIENNSKSENFPSRDVMCNTEKLNNWMREHGNTAYLKTQDWVPNAEITYTDKHLLRDKALKVAKEMFEFTDGSVVSLEASIALKIDPECIVGNLDEAAGGQVHGLSQRVKKWLRRRNGKESSVA